MTVIASCTVAIAERHVEGLHLPQAQVDRERPGGKTRKFDDDVVPSGLQIRNHERAVSLRHGRASHSRATSL